MSKTIRIKDIITVGDLAKKLDIPPAQLISELIKNGVMATVNEKIDFDTAQIVSGEIFEDITLEKEEADAVGNFEARQKREVSADAKERPPIVAVMGHVDHGKTSLLDAIREEDVAEGEAGGITQHISAYQISYKDRKLTFLDTPGHEAFAALREHGAQLTDVAVIVVAADDGIKPQTKEAIRFARRAGVKIVVAANKMDKATSDINKLKQQLHDEKLSPEEWGGDTVVVEVSAKTKKGVSDLLDMILLVADVEELKADYDVPAQGIIIEAHMDRGKGAVATALVEHGLLKTGNYIAAGPAYAKIRTMTSTDGKKIEEAGPSMPVVLTGFKSLPRFGDTFSAHQNDKKAKQVASDAEEARGRSGANQELTSTDLIAMINKNRDQQAFNVLVRADVQGSLKSVIDSMRTLEHQEVTPRIVGQGVGSVSENDVRLAQSSGAVIYGFNVSVPASVKRMASQEGVTIQLYSVIYELIDDVKESLSTLLSDEIVDTDLGRLVVKAVFRTTKSAIICGGEVTKGKITPNTVAIIETSDGEKVEAVIEKVQRGQQEAKEVVVGDMCGLQIKTDKKIALEEGDRVNVIKREVVSRSI